MHHLSLLLFTATSMAGPFAAHIKTRDLPAITGTMEAIGTAIDTAAAGLTAWDGKGDSVEGILKASGAILEEMKKGSAKISGSAALGIMDAAAVIGPSNTLSGKVEGVMAAMVGKKDAFQKLGVLTAVVDVLKEQKGGADELQKAILGKMPALAQPIAGPMAKQIGDKLDAAIATLSEGMDAAPAAPAAPAAAVPAPKAPAPKAPAPKAPAPPPAKAPAPKAAAPKAAAPKPPAPKAPAKST
jgi:hypothetical protein